MKWMKATCINIKLQMMSQVNYDIGNDEDTNHVTDDLSTKGYINIDEHEEDELEDDEVMSKDVSDIDAVEENVEKDVPNVEVIIEETCREDEDEGIEVESNSSGRLKR